ncbi:Protein S-acyltransferase 23 [Actinidia chinensis var. chinensis]|uniref:S-acyltransferase n=1 Tax=Actinidia chinensis var. chinensis TaxID=1590841 RepID=A0A2R6P7S5_ACTCC|nr:Protein S-acyltransferase 23 [Actinidia chinensis var. chinensis]
MLISSSPVTGLEELKMAESEDRRNRRTWPNLIGRCLVSLIIFSQTQLALYMVPFFIPNSSVLSLLSLSAMVLLVLTGVGRFCKRLLRVRASAPAFVFLNILFIWGVYVGVVRQVVSSLMNFMLNMEFLMLMIGLCSILSTDPGYVTNESTHLNNLVESPVSVFEVHSKELLPSTYDMRNEFAAEENSVPLQRVRHCRHCKAYVKGFDHHCPAFGNCIGQKNLVLFIILLVGFVFTEASYVACSSQFIAKIQIVDKTGHLTSSSRNLAISTMIFSLLQLLWQGVFLAWHIYCVCFNIRTDEWINWKRYPEFHLVIHHEPGEIPNGSETRFTNPYNKGIWCNLKEFLTAKE